MAKRIGHLSETRDELEIQWRIMDFFSLPNQYAYSRSFHFSGLSWSLGIMPNGGSYPHLAGWVGVYVVNYRPEVPRSLTVSFSLETEGGRQEQTDEKSNALIKNKVWGISKFLQRSKLESKRFELVPSDVLTVVCVLKHSNQNDIEISRFGRLDALSYCFKKIFDEKKQTDVVLKVQDREFPAHRVILESRSPVFCAMFNHDMEESKTGTVNIEDIHPDAFEQVLKHIYYAGVRGMSFENVFDVYIAADKYDFPDLKQVCREYIEGNVSADVVCDIIKFADLYNEERTAQIAREYFKDHVKEVLETDHWKTFADEDHAFSMDLITSTVKEIA